MTATSDRHLSVESFVGYLESAAPIDHPIPGTPRIILFTDPARSRIGIRGPATPTETSGPTGLIHVSVHAIHHEGRRMIELAVSDPRLFADAYPLLCAVADRVQMSGLTMTAAVDETLRRLGHLLRPEDALSQETEVGLLGELCLLSGLIQVLGADDAVETWRGGQHEEHDFGLSSHDIEVKTTASERRAHWITSLEQLVPTGTRPLWLVSYQITRAGTGGCTLADLIARVRDLLGTGSSRNRFDEKLRAAGWRHRYTARTHQRWRHRNPPAAFAVQPGFPHLTPTLLTEAGVDTIHITDVRYRLDLTGRTTDQPTPTLGNALDQGQQELL